MTYQPMVSYPEKIEVNFPDDQHNKDIEPNPSIRKRLVNNILD